MAREVFVPGARRRGVILVLAACAAAWAPACGGSDFTDTGPTDGDAFDAAGAADHAGGDDGAHDTGAPQETGGDDGGGSADSASDATLTDGAGDATVNDGGDAGFTDGSADASDGGVLSDGGKADASDGGVLSDGGKADASDGGISIEGGAGDAGDGGISIEGGSADAGDGGCTLTNQTFQCVATMCNNAAQWCENFGLGKCDPIPQACVCPPYHTCTCLLANFNSPCVDGGTPHCQSNGNSMWVSCQ